MAFYKNVLKSNLVITKGSENVCVFVATNHLRKQWGDERPFEKLFLGVTKSHLKKQWGDHGPFEMVLGGHEVPFEKTFG